MKDLRRSLTISQMRKSITNF
uniref:Uncharacterized protein n=1 Tax=Rhizophora mucronata TaxID=61149 RepID=A0A2P2R1H9_RHIMU